jgi:hypothetical protein
MGPLLAAFMMATQRWSVPFWVFTAESALCLTLIVCFLEETYYDRRIAAVDQPQKGNRIQRLVGIAQWRSRHLRNTFGQAMWRVFSVLLKPSILLSNIYYLLVSISMLG